MVWYSHHFKNFPQFSQLQIGTYQEHCQWLTTEAFAICHGDWIPCCYSCWPSTTPEGVQDGVRHSVLQGIWWDRSLDSWMVLGTDFIISILASPYIYRSTKSLHGDIRPSSLTKNPFVNWVLHGIELPLHQNFVYWLSSTAALEQSLRAIWDAASWAAVLILPQLNLTHNFQVVHLFQSTQMKMEKLYTVSKNQTGSWLWLRSWTPYCQT